jgi:hypothetical protein
MNLPDGRLIRHKGETKMATKRGLQVRPPAGLTRYFLRATGQVRGGEGSKRWTVLEVGTCGFGPACLCRNGFAAVDEEISKEGYEDVVSTRANGRLMRHISLGNLEIVGAPPKAADQADA